ncbi:MAG: GyrI-like domain-containing protein [Ferruginibacter sp.]
MDKVKIAETRLIGISLQKSTTNTNGQSGIDCKELWDQFVHDKHIESIIGKVNDNIFGVYCKYEGNSSKPFSYFVGCEVEKDATIPHGLQSIIIPEGVYFKIQAKGKMPDCVKGAWQEIWEANLPRTYQTDFEVYDERSKDWNEAEVDIYLSVED